MNDNRDVNLDAQADDIGAEINTLRLNCITQLITARPITVRLVAVLLTQTPQPARRQRRSRNAPEGKGGDA